MNDFADSRERSLFIVGILIKGAIRMHMIADSIGGSVLKFESRSWKFDVVPPSISSARQKDAASIPQHFPKWTWCTE